MYLGVVFALLFTCVAISDVFADRPAISYRRSSIGHVVQEYPIYDMPDDTEEYVHLKQNKQDALPYRSIIKTHRRNPIDEDLPYRRSNSDGNFNTNINLNKNSQGTYDYAYF